MTATDYRQLHQCVTRAVSEMRGISSRLYITDGAAAELVAHAADELGKLISALQPYRERMTPLETENEWKINFYD